MPPPCKFGSSHGASLAPLSPGLLARSEWLLIRKIYNAGTLFKGFKSTLVTHFVCPASEGGEVVGKFAFEEGEEFTREPLDML